VGEVGGSAFQFTLIGEKRTGPQMKKKRKRTTVEQRVTWLKSKGGKGGGGDRSKKGRGGAYCKRFVIGLGSTAPRVGGVGHENLSHKGNK